MQVKYEINNPENVNTVSKQDMVQHEAHYNLAYSPQSELFQSNNSIYSVKQQGPNSFSSINNNIKLVDGNNNASYALPANSNGYINENVNKNSHSNYVLYPNNVHITEEIVKL